MRRLIITTVAAAALCAPASAQQSSSGSQAGQQAPQAQNQPATQQNGNQSGQNFANTQQQISPDRLSTTQVREIQQALDKMGFKTGRADGKWGPETEAALKDFQKSKNMASNGQLDAMTMTGLGLNPSAFGMAGTSTTTGQAPSSGGGQFKGNSQGDQLQHNPSNGPNEHNLGPNPTNQAK